LLAAFDAAFARGSNVMQGYYAVKDPGLSPAVALRSAALACRHHLRPLGRRRIGASCGLYGNGMAFGSDVVRTNPWSNHLVEDAELQLELLLDGQLVDYVPDAVVRAEMPTSAVAATSQNERWELGRLQLQQRFLPTLVRRSATGGPAPRVAYADAALDLATPPLSVLAALDVAAAGASALLALRPCGHRRFLPFVLGCGSAAVLVVHVLVGLRSVNAPREVYRSLLSAPRFALWKLGLMARVTRQPDSVTWTRTRRNQIGAVA
jgi:hypothetical protein